MSLENNNNNKKNNDKNNNNNKKEKRSLYAVMDKQGFYIILILCVAVVAATALWAGNQKDDYFIGEGPTNPFEEESQPEVTLVEDNTTEDETAEAGRIGEGIPKEEKTEPVEEAKAEVKNVEPKENEAKEVKEEAKETASSVEEAKETSASASMMVPVVGELSLPFADDHLVFHKTLEHWATHKGIDIRASEGTPVRAALDGEVVEVINDTIQGITITLKHENDLYTLYSNLSTDAMVKVGDMVTKGQTISGVGKTSSVKSLEGPLLHFRVLEDEKFVNPEIYLGKLNK